MSRPALSKDRDTLLDTPGGKDEGEEVRGRGKEE
jgi:hypothetical protein